MNAFINSPQEWAIVLIVVLVLFGGSRLPKLARGLGQAQREFKEGLADGRKQDAPKPAATDSSSPDD